jgi:pyruvate dehydrogenase E1 component alpha subunit
MTDDSLGTTTPQTPALTGRSSPALLRCMKRIRLVEEAIASRYGEEKMRCPTHLSIGPWTSS